MAKKIVEYSDKAKLRYRVVMAVFVTILFSYILIDGFLYRKERDEIASSTCITPIHGIITKYDNTKGFVRFKVKNVNNEFGTWGFIKNAKPRTKNHLADYISVGDSIVKNTACDTLLLYKKDTTIVLIY
jgi:hypothetical protein